jgi:hypothetical protein
MMGVPKHTTFTRLMANAETLISLAEDYDSLDDLAGDITALSALADDATALGALADDATVLGALADHKSGSAQLTSAVTEVSITHGYGSTPDTKQIIITRTNAGGNATVLFVPPGDIGATTFKVKSNAAPGGTDTADFNWRII